MRKIMIKNKLKDMAVFWALAISCIGLMMAGLSMLNALPSRWALWIFVFASCFSALIYFIISISIWLKK